eukprot:SAG11_NODE_1515_length_4766_cov_3.591172_3_plen_83_part_00
MAVHAQARGGPRRGRSTSARSSSSTSLHAVTDMMWRTTMALVCTLAVLHLPAAEAAAKNFFMIVSFYSGRLGTCTRPVRCSE